MDYGVDQRLYSIAGGLGLVEDGFELRAISETDGGSCRVGDELGGEVSRDLAFIGEDALLEFADVAEVAPVGQRARGIYREGVVEVEEVASLADSLGLRLAGFQLPSDRAVMVAPASGDVETFEREARRIDLGVTGIADGLVTMFGELLADGGSAARSGSTAGFQAGAAAPACRECVR